MKFMDLLETNENWGFGTRLDVTVYNWDGNPDHLATIAEVYTASVIDFVKHHEEYTKLEVTSFNGVCVRLRSESFTERVRLLSYKLQS